MNRGRVGSFSASSISMDCSFYLNWLPGWIWGLGCLVRFGLGWLLQAGFLLGWPGWLWAGLASDVGPGWHWSWLTSFGLD